MTFDDFLNKNVEKSKRREFKAFVEDYGSVNSRDCDTWDGLLLEYNNEFKRTHPGFIVKCERCRSEDVYVDISVGYSSVSGAWGSVDLTCHNCGKSVVIFQP